MGGEGSVFGGSWAVALIHSWISMRTEWGDITKEGQVKTDLSFLYLFARCGGYFCSSNAAILAFTSSMSALSLSILRFSSSTRALPCFDLLLRFKKPRLFS